MKNINYKLLGCAVFALLILIGGSHLSAADLDDNNPITADGDYEINWSAGRKGFFAAAGDFGDGTIKLQYKIGEIWVDFPDASLTDDGGIEFKSPSSNLRVNLSGSTSPEITVVITY